MRKNLNNLKKKKLLLHQAQNLLKGKKLLKEKKLQKLEEAYKNPGKSSIKIIEVKENLIKRMIEEGTIRMTGENHTIKMTGENHTIRMIEGTIVKKTSTNLRNQSKTQTTKMTKKLKKANTNLMVLFLHQEYLK